MQKIRETLQETIVQVLDRKIPFEGAGRRKNISQREAVLRRLFERAQRGHPAAIKLLFEVKAEEARTGYGRY